VVGAVCSALQHSVVVLHVEHTWNCHFLMTCIMCFDLCSLLTSSHATLLLASRAN